MRALWNWLTEPVITEVYLFVAYMHAIQTVYNIYLHCVFRQIQFISILDILNFPIKIKTMKCTIKNSKLNNIVKEPNKTWVFFFDWWSVCRAIWVGMCKAVFEKNLPRNKNGGRKYHFVNHIKYFTSCIQEWIRHIMYDGTPYNSISYNNVFLLVLPPLNKEIVFIFVCIVVW